MGGVQDLIENIKYADAALKKKIILGSVAGVLFLVAGVFLIRTVFGGSVAEMPTETEQAALELREQLDGDSSAQTEVDDPQPFTNKAAPPPR
ncbi:MAG: hypothetical protein ACFCBV_09095 [Phycisphaerales bacterium]